MTRASVVIVGAGVIGASVAYHLAARGWRDILLLDRSSGPGRGSTGAATGGFRAQYGTPVNIRLSLLARQKLLCFKEETGVDPGYLQAGYLWLATTLRELDLLREGLRVQRAEGLHEVREVTATEIAELNPAIRRDIAVGGVFCPTDGFIAPLEILKGYLSAAKRMGVQIGWDTEVVQLQHHNGRIASVN